MKTKHRTPWQWTNESALHKGELRATIIEQTTRWKRKNRVKQLKATIARCNGSHLPKWSPVHHAFCILKRMNHPDRKAPHTAWAHYLDELELVRQHIHYAILQAHLAGYKALPPVYPPHRIRKETEQ